MWTWELPIEFIYIIVMGGNIDRMHLQIGRTHRGKIFVNKKDWEEGDFIDSEHEELDNIVYFINIIESILNPIIDRYKRQCNRCESEKQVLKNRLRDYENRDRRDRSRSRDRHDSSRGYQKYNQIEDKDYKQLYIKYKSKYLKLKNKLL